MNTSPIEPDQTIPTFLKVIKNNPELFSLKDLGDLDKTLDALENEFIDKITDGIQAWYKDIQRCKIRDEVLNCNSFLREITRVSPREQTEDDTAIENCYRELRQTVKDQLKAQPLKSQPIKSDGKHE